LRKAVTDPNKIRKNDPGNPDICLVFSYHKKFNKEEIPEIDAGCRSGALGCVDCKMNCSSKISAFLEPVREKRNYYEKNIDLVKDILMDGERRAGITSEETMKQVRKNMKMG